MDVISVVSVLGLLKRWGERRIFIVPIFLRSRANLPGGQLMLKISNNLGHKAIVNCISLLELNGRRVREIKTMGPKEPFKIENKDFENRLIIFEGELRKGKNNGIIRAAVEDFRGRYRFDKKFSISLDQD